MLKDWRSRFEAWVTRHQRPAHGPIRLDRRRIYILPTRQGYAFALLLLLLFLWSINYSNSMGFAFTFLLTAVALNTMWQAHDNLLGLVIQGNGAEPVFAGQDARFGFRLENPRRTPRHGIALQWRDREPLYVDVPAQSSVPVTLAVPAERRGWLRPGHVRVMTRFPLGLFQSWSWVEFDSAALVYPRPRGRRPLPAALSGTPGSGLHELGAGSEDYAGFRQYAPGDSPRRIAWKAATRTDRLLVKRFIDQARPELWLDWRLLGVENVEPRLEQLCQWVLKAENDGHEYGLRLPGSNVPPARGDPQRRRCLEALALFTYREDFPRADDAVEAGKPTTGKTRHTAG
ncbi:MAG TPA: DUF58 domain-containing protein [Candidatus Competibacter sp.]|nr:DUF58 domain-containing protein [Candidatus Competibacteraceae bacterium]HRC72001.1 DUF58 domain-containing protein [Candidatus Competibacter sp.]